MSVTDCTVCRNEFNLLSMTSIVTLKQGIPIAKVCDECINTYKYPSNDDWIGIRLAEDE